DEEQRVERVLSRRLDVRRLIDPGVAVPGSTELLHDALHFIAGNVGGALEIHVLDPVRDTGTAGEFVTRAHAIPAPHGYEGRRVQLLYQDPQSIVQKGGAHHP